MSGGAVSSRGSSFLGSSAAGSVTAAAPAAGGGGGPAVASMTMMFDRFNEKAIKAVMTASDESRRLGHNFVSTEMLLGPPSDSTKFWMPMFSAAMVDHAKYMLSSVSANMAANATYKCHKLNQSSFIKF
ncbi:unnamed protein product [Prorocentrum cordatum]|uniref:Uncharacterized protein n=1 Tax=Prorocentrum cordatum TaxID=2364126 RepID=A0ABN9TZ05_9DINO|nr:unnamed protein product [Polarella glacialis]